MKKTKKPRCLILFSGGLDSRLVCKILEEQLGKKNIEAIFFQLPFGSGCCNKHCALKFSQIGGIKIKFVDATKGKLLQDYLKIIKKPKFGYGTGLNPCIDCRIFLLKYAKKYADAKGIEIIATGEVLNERPMSQHKNALEIIEKASGLKGRLLRPLSAKLLAPTKIEKSGEINRKKLFAIHGRSRKKQISLAKKYKITYPNPGGGCLLCEKEFCKKLKPLLNKKLDEADISLLKIGRHFEKSNIILGRNREENMKIEQIFKKYKKGILLIPENPAPTALIKNKKYLKKAKELMQKYSKYKIEKIRSFSKK